MKKISIVLITLCLFLSSGLTAYAQTGITITPSDPGAESGAVEIIDLSAEDAPQHGGVPVRDVPVGLQPQSVQSVTENGVPLIKKTYEVSPEVDPQTLIQPFEQDGYSFTGREILRRELPGETLTRVASKTAIADSDNDDKAGILKQFPAVIDHEEDGYTGQLHLDTSTIQTEADAYETYTYSYTKTKEFSALDRNDTSYIGKELDGMRLTGVTFTGQREEQIGNSLVPTQYTGIARYTGTAVGKRPTAYVATATYYGEITKTMPGNILYTVVYEGIAAELPAESAEQEAPEPDEPEQVERAESEAPANGGLTLFHIALTGIAGILIGGVLIPKVEPLLQKIFRKKREENEE